MKKVRCWYQNICVCDEDEVPSFLHANAIASASCADLASPTRVPSAASFM